MVAIAGILVERFATGGGGGKTSRGEVPGGHISVDGGSMQGSEDLRALVVELKELSATTKVEFRELNNTMKALLDRQSKKKT